MTLCEQLAILYFLYLKQGLFPYHQLQTAIVPHDMPAYLVRQKKDTPMLQLTSVSLDVMKNLQERLLEKTAAPFSYNWVFAIFCSGIPRQASIDQMVFMQPVLDAANRVAFFMPSLCTSGIVI